MSSVPFVKLRLKSPQGGSILSLEFTAKPSLFVQGVPELGSCLKRPRTVEALGIGRMSTRRAYRIIMGTQPDLHLRR